MKTKIGHRLVVLPDFQGLGIGHEFCSQICQHYIDQGFRFLIVSSTKALFKQRNRDPRWVVYSKSRKTSNSKSGEIHGRHNKTPTSARFTYSYEFIGEKK